MKDEQGVNMKRDRETGREDESERKERYKSGRTEQ